MSQHVAINIKTQAYHSMLGAHYTLHDCTAGYTHLTDEERAATRVLVTAGFRGATGAEMDELPNLALICCVGTGYEGIDVQAALARGIRVSHGAGVNAGAVADHAMALLLSAVRAIPHQDRLTRSGAWNYTETPRPLVSRKKMGIFGMGGIGAALARRAAAFDIEVSYHSRTPKTDLPYAYVASLRELAEASDYLVACVPGGPSTQHAVNAEVLEALGPKGYFFNVGRGSVVDTAALIAALQSGTIKGAGLDVFETEPDVPAELCALENVVLTPHMAGNAPEVQEMAADLIRENITAFNEGRALVSPVPEMRALTPAI
ncbi:NAD(P)-dependent oxidoreductase [Salipiger mangrovisoli]|uniref:2-hydroxyacid dehydrogenase n=1 Tax=Salipiger mangrovisoli TaxID=2865933 RepID=A0ABR9X0X4_9RHOB|nr:NAD(P)-dependent oxidoreductase [Salipiger mangrovisoli]MBE9637091.1 2-hydroxyacid dehydrogenase [Salipiger mangrovisoli]